MKYFVYLFFYFITVPSFGQKQGNIWYFGSGAGLDFNANPVVALTNGQVNTTEGCAVIADATTGSLLFYTDGILVWDKNHIPMPGSLATPLAGDPSSSQSGVIVPKPGSNTIFYVFTTPSTVGAQGMCYSIVDMTLNGGNGDVTNINTKIMDDSEEKIAVIGNCQSSIYWVVGRKFGADSFYSFKVTASGVAAPVRCIAGNMHTLANSVVASIGYLKFSPDGKKLGMANYQGLNTAEIFDFDFNTGLLSNAILDVYNVDEPYGVSFSPDNSRLYISCFRQDTSRIFQYNMLAGSNAAIKSSRVQVAIADDVGSFLGNRSFGALQNSKDGRMYIARFSSDTLSYFANPNSLGTACNYVSNGIYLQGKQSTAGLTSIVENFLSNNVPRFTPPPFTIDTNIIICKGDTVNAIQVVKNNFTILPIGSFSVSTDSLIVNFYPLVTTTYSVINAGDCGSNDTNMFTIIISPDPIANFIFNPALPSLRDASITLQNTSQNATTYKWFYQNNLLSTIENYVFPIPGLGTFCFLLEAKNEVGCVDTAYNCISVDDTIVSTIYVPSAFSPNGDDRNDVIKVNGKFITLMDFMIVNRFGEVVFKTNDITKGWDGKYLGKDAEIGVYYYNVNFLNYKGKKKIKKGDITLVR